MEQRMGDIFVSQPGIARIIVIIITIIIIVVTLGPRASAERRLELDRGGEGGGRGW